MLDAAIALLGEGDLKPTAAAIAARAGLSVRSVFQHFADLEDLFLAASDRQADRIALSYARTNYAGDLSSRVDAFVLHRATLYETIGPLGRAAMLHEPFSQGVAARLELARSLHRRDIERAFRKELDAARAAGDGVLADTIAAMCSFVVWDEMRRFARLDVASATAALRRIVSTLLMSRAGATA